MKKLFTLSAATIFSLNSFSQAPAIQWNFCFGGSGYDEAHSVLQATDSGYIVAGCTRSGNIPGFNGTGDFWVVKLTNTSFIQWQRCYGGLTYDVAESIKHTSDGGYVVTGCASSSNGDVSGNHGNYDFWVVKLDSNGFIQWEKCYGGTDRDWAYDIQQTIEGGYIVVGMTTSNNGDVSGWHFGLNTSGHLADDCWIIKIDPVGNLQWQKCLGGGGNDTACAVIQTLNGDYIIAGYTSSFDGDVVGNHGSEDMWVIKLDSSGNLLWKKCYGGTDQEKASDIQQTIDGGYVIVGYNRSNNGDVTGNHGYRDVWVVKIDTAGIIQWQKSLGGPGFDEALSVEQTIDSGYIVAGSNYSNGGDVVGNQGYGDFWVVKLNSQGAFQWQKSLGGTDRDVAYSVIQTNDAGYIIAGVTWSFDGDVDGDHRQDLNYDDCWIVKLAPESIVGVEENNFSSSIILFPNPATYQLLLTITNHLKPNTTASIYSFLGAEVLAVPVTNSQTNINISVLPAGVYFVNVKEGGRSVGVRKLVKI